MDERTFLGSSDTAGALVAKCRGLTEIQAKRVTDVYLGKWIKLAGYICAVSPLRDDISVTVVESSGADCAHYMVFSQDQERLELANLGDILVAIGKINHVSKTGLGLGDCEVVVIETPEKQIGLFAPSHEIAAPPTAHLAVAPESKPRPLAVAEMERFATLYVGIYDSAAVEGNALTAIRACFPNNSIGRDAFFKIFREIRGPGKRGNPAFRGKDGA